MPTNKMSDLNKVALKIFYFLCAVFYKSPLAIPYLPKYDIVKILVVQN